MFHELLSPHEEKEKRFTQTSESPKVKELF